MFSIRTAVTVSLLLTVPAFAQFGPAVEEAKFTPAPPGAPVSFGRSVAVYGDTAVVGAPDDDDGGLDAGAAYVYVRSGTTWTQQAKLIAPDAAAGDAFATSVSISVDTVMIGAPGADIDAGAGALADSGAAYVFVRSGTTWSQQAKLWAGPANAAAQDVAGTSVCVSGETAVLGVPGADTADGIDAGSVYVFQRSGTSWSAGSELTAPDAAAGDGFGRAVATSAHTIVAGTSFTSGSKPGAVYVFTPSGSGPPTLAELFAPTSSPTFGHSVSISVDSLIVGDEGAASYVFTRDSGVWTLQATLAPSGVLPGGGPTSVSLRNDFAVVGTPYPSSVGSACVFERTGTSWSQDAVLTGSGTTSGDGLGHAVGVDGQTVVVGADLGTSNAGGGQAYAFRLQPIGTWLNLGHGLAGVGGIPLLVGTGYLQGGSPLTLSLTQAKPSALAPIVIGVTIINAKFKGGIMVPHPDFIFTPVTNASGASTLGGTWPPGLPSGFAIFFHWWIHDPAGPKGYAASNAISANAP